MTLLKQKDLLDIEFMATEFALIRDYHQTIPEADLKSKLRLLAHMAKKLTEGAK